jgi:hypothetical protein
MFKIRIKSVIVANFFNPKMQPFELQRINLASPQSKEIEQNAFARALQGGIEK